MARRALLIGSQTGALTGVGNDVAAMAAALDGWGFTGVVTCEEENASRAGILDAYERLIADTRPQDTVVVYYSGHGGYSRAPAGGAVAPHRRTLQFIVPTDYHSSTEDDFRGVTSVELSLLLARLTERTNNATVVLDCCHAAHMSREWEFTTKALSRAVSYRLIAAHLDGLRRRGQRIEQWTAPGNPNAVRVVACAPEQAAFEFNNHKGIRTGMLTDALTRALAEAKDLSVSWATVIDRVRQRVLTVMPRQRPEAEGPAQRLLFDVAEADAVTSLPVSAVADRIRVNGAALLGVRPGDEFVVMPGDAVVPSDDTKVGDVCVDKVDSAAAFGTLRPAGEVPLGARAHLVRVAAPALPVRVPQDDPRLASLLGAIDAAPLVRLAEAGEDCQVSVVVDATGGLSVHDERGPLHAPRPADATRSVVQDCTRLARARALRCLAEEPAQAVPSPVSVEFGLAEGNQARPLTTSGAVLHVDQPIYVRVRNEGGEVVHVSLLDIGVAARITVLNPSSPGGVRLEPGGEYIFGGNDLTGGLPGVSLSWPADLLRGGPRQETIVVLTTSAPVDTRVLEQQGVRRAGRRAGSKLQRHLDQLGSGGPRDLAPALGPTVRFAVRTIDFELVPAPAPPVEEASFQVDERPDPTVLLWQPRADAPVDVALRLTDLVVHHNRSFRGADIRLDTVVITDGTVHRTHTERFRDISDGQRLLPHDVLVYEGAAVGILDLAVWVSRDSGESPELGELLRDSHAVVDDAHDVLTRTFGDCVGLYRTTLLAREQFGVGSKNTVRAQDFSFQYLIEDARG